MDSIVHNCPGGLPRMMGVCSMAAYTKNIHVPYYGNNYSHC